MRRNSRTPHPTLAVEIAPDEAALLPTLYESMPKPIEYSQITQAVVVALGRLGNTSHTQHIQFTYVP